MAGSVEIGALELTLEQTETIEVTPCTSAQPLNKVSVIILKNTNWSSIDMQNIDGIYN